MVSPEIDQHVFNQAFNTTIGREGFFSNDATDPGGATQYGVSLRYLRTQHVINGDLDHDGDIDVQDIKLLGLNNAKTLFYNDFWLKNKCDQIGNNLIASKIFDLSVNMGLKPAARILQRGINATVGKDICSVDGVIGGQTLYLISGLNQAILLKKIKEAAADQYEFIVQNNPKLKKYINGWLTRAYA